MILEHENYRGYLKQVLADRIAKNPAYSLRAMATQLEVAASTFSEVLNGRKNLSQSMAARVANRLGLKEREQEFFGLLVQMESTKSAESKGVVLKRIKAMRPRREISNLSVDTFQLIADWYHIPILEMTRLDPAEFTPRAIAKRLGITSFEADAAIDRLTRLGLIAKDPDGRYRKLRDWTAVSNAPDEGLRRFHHQMLEKAATSLRTQTPQEKIVGSETFSFDRSQLEEARQITEEYFSRITALSDKAEKRTDVYHVGVQFFNLTKRKTS